MTTISQYGYPSRLPYIHIDATYFPSKFAKKLSARQVSREKETKRPHRFIHLFAAARNNKPHCRLLDRRLSSGRRPSPASRFVLNMLKERLIYRAVQSHLDCVHQSVTEYGGRITYPPVQTKDVCATHVMQQREREAVDGMADELVTRWIRHHARGEVLTHLKHREPHRQVNTNQDLKWQGLQDTFITMPWDRVTESWLSVQGVRLPQRVEVNDLDRCNLASCKLPLTVTGETGRYGTAALLRAMLDTHRKGSCYKKIRFIGEMASHTVAAYVDDQVGVHFFDVYFGEFHFPDKSIFSQWFTQAFWQDTMYGKEMGLGQTFAVVSYEVK